MIIDVHGHLSAPAELARYKERLLAGDFRPLVVTDETGKGRSVYLALDAGSFYSSTGLSYIADYVIHAIDSLTWPSGR